MRKVIYLTVYLIALALGPVLAVLGLVMHFYAATAFGVIWFLVLLGKLLFAIKDGREFKALMDKYKQMNFGWYKATYPNHAHANGVSCHSCGGRRIHVRSLREHTYTREHFCTQCGTALYYSPEN
ncbi:MAG: hypothetical protein Q8S02_11790 [Hydrogenophaga sp.]|nr:hypothetical protein [Hydrogenophaga sp.]